VIRHEGMELGDELRVTAELELRLEALLERRGSLLL